MSIKQRRLKKGWTQEELALHTGLSTRTIQRAENGKSIGAESLKCLAAVFETSTENLIQDQHMNSAQNVKNQETVSLTETENSAIKYGQSLLKTPKNGEKDPLSNIERKAVDFGKALLTKLKR